MSFMNHNYIASHDSQRHNLQPRLVCCRQLCNKSHQSFMVFEKHEATFITFVLQEVLLFFAIHLFSSPRLSEFALSIQPLSYICSLHINHEAIMRNKS